MFAVFTDKVSPRIRYVLEEVLGRRLGKSVRLCFEEQDYCEYHNLGNPHCVKYLEVDRPELPGIFIQRTGNILDQGMDELYEPLPAEYQFTDVEINQLTLYFENQFKRPVNNEVLMLLKSPLRALFKTETKLGFDPFAFAFYSLSRYEEYFPYNSDSLKRFSHQQSIAFKQNWGALPYLDLALVKLYLSLNLKVEEFYRFKIHTTIDIDIAYRFLGRPVFRQLGAWFKYPQWMLARIKTYLTRVDAFASNRTVVPYLETGGKTTLENAQVFVLCSEKNTKYNKQVMRSFGPWKRDIKQLNSITQIGLHPSLNVSMVTLSQSKLTPLDQDETPMYTLHPNSLVLWNNEKLWLERTSGLIPILNSRQHYIHLLFPFTYRYLTQLGIKNDWSMGFAQDLGYRAGTAMPFLWYDLLEDKTTNLTIHPFALMDVTLKNYLNLHPEEAYKITSVMKHICAVLGVPFTFIVHNESLSGLQGWEGWQEVFNSWRDDLKQAKQT